MKLQCTEEKLIQLSPQRQDVLTVTPWLAPIGWEGAFHSEILGSAYRPLNLTTGVTAFAMGKYRRFVPRFLEAAEQHFMKGSQVNSCIFTDNPETIPSVQLQPGRRFVAIPREKHSSWQEISMHRMEAIAQHIAERSHQEVDFLFCLDIDTVFYNAWGMQQPYTLATSVSLEASSLMRGGALQQPTSLREKETSDMEELCLEGWSRKSVSSPRVATRPSWQTKPMGSWQQESHLNRHFLSHKPSKVLSPEYLWDERKPKPPEIHLIHFSTLDKSYKEI